MVNSSDRFLFRLLVPLLQQFKEVLVVLALLGCRVEEVVKVHFLHEHVVPVLGVRLVLQAPLARVVTLHKLIWRALSCQLLRIRGDTL